MVREESSSVKCRRTIVEREDTVKRKLTGQAYSDHHLYLPFLKGVGRPEAVNPTSGLAAVARQRGWHPKMVGGPYHGGRSRICTVEFHEHGPGITDDKDQDGG